MIRVQELNKKYGRNRRPHLTVTSNEGRRVEKVLVSNDGSNYIAKREGEPARYVLEAKPVEELQSWPES